MTNFKPETLRLFVGIFISGSGILFFDFVKIVAKIKYYRLRRHDFFDQVQLLPWEGLVLLISGYGFINKCVSFIKRFIKERRIIMVWFIYLMLFLIVGSITYVLHYGFTIKPFKVQKQ